MANSKSLIAETKSAVNKAMYNCTKQKKAIALKLLKELTAEVEALKVVVPKKKSKTSKAKSKPTPIKGLSKMTKAQLLEHLATLSK